MPGVLPDGQPVPGDGALPAEALRAVGERGFGVYVHVPFCASRCGYCDFNTYTAAEGVVAEGYADTVLAELALAGRVLHDAPPRRVDTVFFGGGTPTLLPPAELGRILDGIDRVWGLAPGAEVTTEANPESVTPTSLAELRAAGFTRISLGMQSAAAHVLAVLDRRHTPGRAAAAAAEARAAGFDQVNLDLIYGTPGETAADFAGSLAMALDAGVDHVSAYALIVEDGTRLAARMRRGELPYPDDDVVADRYLVADYTLTGAGFTWYEVSNWARGAEGRSPGHAREVLTGAERHSEDVLLRLRLADGLPLSTLDRAGRGAARRALADGLLDVAAFRDRRAVLTLRGRLLADAVVRDLLP